MNSIKKINYILSINQKKNFYLLLIVTGFVSFLDLVGIGAILPILIIFTDTEFVSNDYLSYFFENFSFLNENNFLYFSIVFLLFIFLFKIFSSLILNVIKYKILFGFYQKISSRLMNSYINLSYAE